MSLDKYSSVCFDVGTMFHFSFQYFAKRHCLMRVGKGRSTTMTQINRLTFSVLGLYCKPRDWSLIMGRGGGARKRDGGDMKFYPYEMGGGRTKF